MIGRLLKELSLLYPVRRLLHGPQAQNISEEDLPELNVQSGKYWEVISARYRPLANCRHGYNNRILVRVLDSEHRPLTGIPLYFEFPYSPGVVSDRPNIAGETGENGFAEWRHLGVPTVYSLTMDGEIDPLVTGMDTQLGYAYYRPPGTIGGWRPVCGPGLYSFDITIRRKAIE